MTLTIDLPDVAEARLREEADKAGVSVDEQARRMLIGQLTSQSDRMAHLIRTLRDLSRPGVVLADVSREGIYADE